MLFINRCISIYTPVERFTLTFFCSKFSRDHFLLSRFMGLQYVSWSFDELFTNSARAAQASVPLTPVGSFLLPLSSLKSILMGIMQKSGSYRDADYSPFDNSIGLFYAFVSNIINVN